MIKVTWKGRLLRLPLGAVQLPRMGSIATSHFFNPRDDNIPTSTVT